MSEGGEAGRKCTEWLPIKRDEGHQGTDMIYQFDDDGDDDHDDSDKNDDDDDNDKDNDDDAHDIS